MGKTCAIFKWSFRKRVRSMTSMNWRMYERFVAALESSKAQGAITVIPNAELIGTISRTKRQIDVLIDNRIEEDTTRRVIIDAKFRRRKIDVRDVELFEGTIKDCRAHHGILVCP